MVFMTKANLQTTSFDDESNKFKTASDIISAVEDWKYKKKSLSAILNLQ